MGQKEELQVLSEALQALREDESPSFLSQFIQLTFDGRCAELLLDQEDQCSSATSGSR